MALPVWTAPVVAFFTQTVPRWWRAVRAWKRQQDLTKIDAIGERTDALDEEAEKRDPQP